MEVDVNMFSKRLTCFPLDERPRARKGFIKKNIKLIRKETICNQLVDFAGKMLKHMNFISEGGK